MITLKTQIEIRYLPILNFKDLYRTLVNPFIKDSKIEFGKINTQEEHIILKFPDEGYLVDIRWDRIVYACDGKKDNFYTANGPLFIFFSIFEKIRGLADFGEILNVLLAQWDLAEADKKEETIIQLFRSKYLQNVPIVDDYKEDLAIMVDFENKENIIKLHFGPYNEKKDVQFFGLAPISKENRFLLTKKGVLVNTILTQKTNFADIEVFKRMDKKIQALTSQIVL
jgi:hypothetical protein